MSYFERFQETRLYYNHLKVTEIDAVYAPGGIYENHNPPQNELISVHHLQVLN